MGSEAVSGFGVRHGHMLLIFLMQAFSLAIRVNVSVALVAMTDNTINPKFPMVGWSAVEEGAFLSSYAWGQLVARLPASYFIVRLGPARMVQVAMGACGLASLATPVAVHLRGNTAILAVCFTRIVQGVANAFIFSGVYALMSKWVVPQEREKCISFVFGGAQIGIILMMFGGGFLAAGPGGWPSIFYLTGILCIGWTLLGSLFLADSPKSHRSISPEERDYIVSHLKHNAKSSKNVKTPWAEMLCSVPVWALIADHMAENWAMVTLNSMTPLYLHNVFHFNIKKDGVLSSLPLVGKLVAAFVLAFLAELLIKKKILSVSYSRKMWNSIAQYGSCLTLTLLAFLNLSAGGAVTLLVFTSGLAAGFYPGLFSNHLDLSPNFASTLSSLTSNFADISSILAPIFAGFIITDHTNVHEWRIVFIVAAGFAFLAGTIFNIFGSKKVQKWNFVDGGTDEEKQSEHKNSKEST